MEDQKSAAEASEHRVGRRRFLTGLAGLGAGMGATLAGPILQPQAADAQPGSPGSTSSAASDPVIASDAGTVIEISPGKLRGYRRNGIYIFKGIPYGASTDLQHFSLAEASTASVTRSVASAARKSGCTASPACRAKKKSAAWWMKVCS